MQTLKNCQIIQKLIGIQVGVEAELLRQIAQQALYVSAICRLAHIIAADECCALGWGQERRQHAHERGFARAVRPQQANQARLDG